MAQPNQRFGMTNINGQPMVPLEYPNIYGLPPPYRINEGDCTNATNETAAEHYQPM